MNVAVVAETRELIPQAQQLATQYQLPFLQEKELHSADFLVRVSAQRVALYATQDPHSGAVYAEFVRGKPGYRHRHGGGRKQILARAVGLSKPQPPAWVMDATAGLGRDAFVLAGLGCRVSLYERSPVVRALLQDGLQRAVNDPVVGEIIRTRMQLITQDACLALRCWESQARPEVIYLDPMYPSRRKKALVKQEMRFFRAVVGDDNDAPALLEAALAIAQQRVVIKRPAKSPSIGPRIPSFQLFSPNTRFDVYSTR